MAIDSFQKRTSASGVGRPYLRATYPTGVINQAWRMSAGNTYSGNELIAWQCIDPTQVPGWTCPDPTQVPGWTCPEPSQVPGWVEV